jgi:hypothetical protein
LSTNPPNLRCSQPGVRLSRLCLPRP